MICSLRIPSFATVVQICKAVTHELTYGSDYCTKCNFALTYIESQLMQAELFSMKLLK
jgi:hypothetical protein